MKTELKPQKSIDALRNYLVVPMWVTSCEWEIVSLPEQAPSDFPGPTDYVVLLVVLRSDAATKANLKIDAPAISSTPPVQGQFLRPWMPASSTQALQKLGTTSIKLYDIAAWVKRPVKRAFAVESTGEVLLYVEYVAPAT